MKKEIYFSVGEQNIIEELQEVYGVTYLVACEKVIDQKRELAWMHSKMGNFDLAEQILREISEWNSQIAEDFEKQGRNEVKNNKDYNGYLMER